MSVFPEHLHYFSSNFHSTGIGMRFKIYESDLCDDQSQIGLNFAIFVLKPTKLFSFKNSTRIVPIGIGFVNTL